MRVPVGIVGLYSDPMSEATIVLLSEPGEVTRVLPIFIGAAEAQAIALALAGVEVPRPGTHDLMVAAMAQLGGQLGSVTVTELVGGAFLAEVTLEQDEHVHVLDARPSDGIALAVRSGAALFVEAAVMIEAGVAVEHAADEPFDESEIENIVAEFHDFLAGVAPDDFAGSETSEPPGIIDSDEINSDEPNSHETDSDEDDSSGSE